MKDPGHAHVDEFMHEETLIRARLEAGVFPEGGSEEVIRPDECAVSMPVPPADRARAAAGPHEALLVLAQEDVDAALPVRRPEWHGMIADQFGNGLGHPRKAGELGVHDFSFGYHAEVPGGDKLCGGALVLYDLEAHGLALELAWPGPIPVGGILLGREWQGEEQQQGGGTEHELVFSLEEAKTRECTEPVPGHEDHPMNPGIEAVGRPDS